MLVWDVPGPAVARCVAFDVLLRVEQGAYAGDLLLHRGQFLQPADAALAQEIVFGVLRRQPQLDFLLQPYLRRELSRLDPGVRTALRMGAFQLHYLERVPVHAIVNDSVGLVKRARLTSASGLVNAVLRKVHSAGLPDSWPDRETRLCVPAWMLARWDAAYGADRADRIAEAFLQKPAIYVRIPPSVSPTDFPQCELDATDIHGCYRVLRGNPGAAGLRQSDIGSQWIGTLVQAGPSDPVLDLCAAPGNKTAVIAERAPIAAACDLHLSRLRSMPPPHHPRVQLDAAEPLPFHGKFPWILLDAPCSGTGTLGRNPEIRWRISPAAIEAFPPLQRKLLRNALAVLAPGGTLVYSTCSLEVEENENVVADICHDYDVEVLRRLPGEAPGDGFFAAVIRAR
jgi:16S rRNA (cytosine967-C5)-methyltransferase